MRDIYSLISTYKPVISYVRTCYMTLKTIISSENIQRQQEPSFTCLLEADVTDLSYQNTYGTRIITYITSFE